MGSIQEKIRTELLTAQEKGYKISVQKLLFITTLLGLGSVRVESIVEFYPILYWTPVVAVLFDVQEMGQKFTVRRIGAFLRCYSDDELEREWEDFVSKHREHLYKYASDGFTILTFVISIVLLAYAKGEQAINGSFMAHLNFLSYQEYLWFFFLFSLYVSIRIAGRIQHKSLDSIKRPEPGVDNTN